MRERETLTDCHERTADDRTSSEFATSMPQGGVPGLRPRDERGVRQAGSEEPVMTLEDFETSGCKCTG